MSVASHTIESSRRALRDADDRGFMMVAILIGMGVAAIVMTTALPAWRQQVQREREEELIFRGEQYAQAIVLYSLKNNGALPPDIDSLVSGHFLRKKWKDPITNEDFNLVGVGIVNLPGPGQMTPVGGMTPTPAGRGGQPAGGAPAASGGRPGVSGVRSKSTGTSIKIYQQQQAHNLWAFDASFAAQKMGINMNQIGNQQGQPGRQGGQPGQGGLQQPGRGGGPTGVQPGRGGDAGRGVPAAPGRGGTTPPATTGRGPGRGSH